MRDDLLLFGGIAGIVAWLWHKTHISAINEYIDNLAQQVTGDVTQSGGGIIYDLLHPSTGWADLANGGKMPVPSDVWAARWFIVNHPEQFDESAVMRAGQQILDSGKFNDNPSLIYLARHAAQFGY